MSKDELIKDAKEGNADSQLMLGYKYYIGMRGFDKDIDKARLWWYRAAINDNKEAQFNLGMLFYTGEGMPLKDKKEAFHWWGKAANNGFELASAYLKSPPAL